MWCWATTYTGHAQRSYLIVVRLSVASWRSTLIIQSVYYGQIESSHRCSIAKSVLKNFAIFTGKFLCWSLFWTKLQACNFLKKRLQHRYFPVNVVKFSRTPILKYICKWLLLCTSPISSTIIFQIHTELLLHVQLSLLRDIFWVISVDNKI